MFRLLLPFFILNCSCLSADAPDWLMQAAQSPTPATAEKAPYVILMDDLKYEITPSGDFIETHRHAIRILKESASKEAVGSVHYNGTANKIDTLNAWLIRNHKVVERRSKGDWYDVSMNAEGAVVDETRMSGVNLGDKAAHGDVFGFETRQRGPLVVAQLRFANNTSIPNVRDSFSLVLPPGFNLIHKGYGENIPDVQQPAPNIWSWTFHNPHYLPEESYEIPASRRSAVINVRIIPPANPGKFAGKDFQSWSEVSQYVATLKTGQCDASPALSAKAHALTDGLADPLAKIAALGAYVQKLRYVAFNQNLKLGHGYRPRKASLVFSTGFGDCKDKSNLLIAMLREIGITAHAVHAYLGKDYIPKAECPSPGQFNHAITAIQVGPETLFPSVVEHTQLGRLLIFDPTDPNTLVGDLSFNLQGSLVHIDGTNDLTPLPSLPANQNFRQDRRLDLTLSPDGAAQISGRITADGQAGANLRRSFEEANMPSELEKLVTQQLNDKYRGAAITQKTSEDDPVTRRCTLTFTCTQPKFIQWIQGGTGIVKLDLLSRRHIPNIPETERKLPVGLRPVAVDDEIVLHLPAGYTVSETPATVEFSSPFGNCRVSCENKGDGVVFRRKVTIHETIIPVNEYPALRKFLTDLIKADRATVLIKPQG